MKLAVLALACGGAAVAPPADPPRGGDTRDPPRVLADRWVMTTSSPMPFAREAIERGFQDAKDDVSACLQAELIPMITATVRLTWRGGKASATVVDEDRGLGACAAAALVKVSWLAPDAATLDVIVSGGVVR